MGAYFKYSYLLIPAAEGEPEFGKEIEERSGVSPEWALDGGTSLW